MDTPVRPTPVSSQAGAAPRQRLGDQLLALGLISQDELRIALQEQKYNSQPLGEALLALGCISKEAMRGALAEQLGQQAIGLKGVVADPAALALVPKAMAKRHRLFPVSLAQGELLLASANPNDIVAADQISAMLGGTVQPRWALASSAEILSAIEHCYGHELSIDGILQELESGADLTHLNLVAEGYSHPVVRLMDALLADATIAGASDLHFEPEPQFLRIRYRIDGVLRQVRALHTRYWPAMIVRLKVMAGMNIAETRAPQDGRIARTIAGHSVDFRASAQPTTHGENFVLRILDRQRGVMGLDQLGLSSTQLSLLHRMLSRPEGILLVTGPTGAGKTTTLYSILHYLNAEGVNIMTLEDPVEFPMPWVRQTSISDAVKMGFADGIRSMMRQDPDIILVGEVRDQDTAVMAFRAAMTGHQVFSTLHTNSALHAIPRLLDLGIAPQLLAGNVIGVVAQRLVRKLCPQCKLPHPPSADESQCLGGGEGVTLYRSVGCAACGFRGFKGRVAIVELLKFDAELDDLVTRQAGLKAMADHLRERGFVAMAEDGLRRVREGDTTLEEVARVLDLTEWIR